MKTKIIKGITSALVSFAVFVIMSIVLTIFIKRGLFVYNTLDMFPPNAFGIIDFVVSTLIPIIFCEFTKFTELFVYSVSFYISGRVQYMVVFGGLYAIAFTLEHYGVELPFVIPDKFLDAIFYNLVYISIGIIIGFICSIVVNIIRNIREKKVLK